MRVKCETMSCDTMIEATQNRRFCRKCANKRRLEKGRKYIRETRSVSKLREIKAAKRKFTHCTICGHKLAECNITGKCLHYGSWAPLHGQNNLYIGVAKRAT